MRRHITTRSSRVKHVLYFVECPIAGTIKIGITRDAEYRFRELEWASPVPLKLLFYIPGTARQEHALHLKFSDERARGEWFTASPRLLAFIEELTGLSERDACARISRLRTPTRRPSDKPRRRTQKERAGRLWSAVENIIAARAA